MNHAVSSRFGASFLLAGLLAGMLPNQAHAISVPVPQSLSIKQVAAWTLATATLVGFIDLYTKKKSPTIAPPKDDSLIEQIRYMWRTWWVGMQGTPERIDYTAPDPINPTQTKYYYSKIEPSGVLGTTDAWISKVIEPTGKTLAGVAAIIALSSVVEAVANQGSAGDKGHPIRSSLQKLFGLDIEWHNLPS